MIKLAVTAGVAAVAAFWLASEARRRGWVSSEAAQLFIAGATGALVGKWFALK